MGRDPDNNAVERKQSTDAASPESRKQRDPSWPPRIALIIRNQLEAYCEKRKSTDYRKEGRERWTIFLLFLTTVFTFIAAVIFYRQLQEMQRVYGPIKEQADTAYKTMVAGTRAWLTPVSIDTDSILSVNGTVNFMITYGNVGKEPAAGLVGQEEFGIVDFPKGKRWYDVFPESKLTPQCPKAAASAKAGTKYPSGLRDYVYLVNNVGKPENLVISPDVITGAKVMFVHGCFKYFTFDIVRESEYCFLLIPEIDQASGLAIIDSKTKRHKFRSGLCPWGNHAT